MHITVMTADEERVYRSFYIRSGGRPKHIQPAVPKKESREDRPRYIVNKFPKGK
jgi:hypothetical protein